MSGSSDDMDADLALTFLAVVLVSWLPVGTARCVLSLVLCPEHEWELVVGNFWN
ncbi:hypothetical protein ACFU8W_51630 [Streptomyces sp. NPDC057565]|uniref:hypothetical protein n=1 Tax=Streptomyces sp. NPDC057565 TaxID=3346169 RepID=UPI00368D0A66